MEHVALTIENHIADLALMRPDKRNAVSYQMVDELIGAVAQIDASDARVCVLRGEGAGFCAGMDIANFQKFQGDDGKERTDRIMARTHGDANAMQQFALCLQDCRVPVIAALHGMAFGAGFQLALGADIRIAHPECQMSVMELKWGLVPDMGGMVLMPRLTRSDVIKRLTFTADIFPASKMAEWGLVSELSDDPLAAARALAEKIASKSPSAVQAGKRLIRVAEEGEREKVLYEESREQCALIGNPHQAETVMAFLQKREPKFT
ncbi:crotonase/enoyl-CoA hydratase family protein [Aliiroseovarius sp. PTFE2010]|uniref:crotonase/enoyl-CoA hydratase family protein n=1 Tax=Aliiroseovarius sp. PTFE2010 TaxID=3417190 RepID=UPI003CEE2452